MVASTIEINGLKAEGRDTFEVNVCGSEDLVPASSDPLYLQLSPKTGVDSLTVSPTLIDQAMTYIPFNGLELSQCHVESIEFYNSADLSEVWGSSNSSELSYVEV
mmetsp:Transcript_7682/g.11905  ORF Transcript_7682/g.11905 Transcript_7682/m.11905 type:complete len:105 (+) Transcript_7682:155-469(+)